MEKNERSATTRSGERSVCHNTWRIGVTGVVSAFAPVTYIDKNLDVRFERPTKIHFAEHVVAI